jgi:hypothetical protein
LEWEWMKGKWKDLQFSNKESGSKVQHKPCQTYLQELYGLCIYKHQGQAYFSSWR